MFGPLGRFVRLHIGESKRPVSNLVKCLNQSQSLPMKIGPSETWKTRLEQGKLAPEGATNCIATAFSIFQSLALDFNPKRLLNAIIENEIERPLREQAHMAMTRQVVRRKDHSALFHCLQEEKQYLTSRKKHLEQQIHAMQREIDALQFHDQRHLRSVPMQRQYYYNETLAAMLRQRDSCDMCLDDNSIAMKRLEELQHREEELQSNLSMAMDAPLHHLNCSGYPELRLSPETGWSPISHYLTL